MSKCPVCGATETKDSATKKIKWKIRNFRSHIRKMAEREALYKALNLVHISPHLDYVRKNLVKIETTTFSVKI